MKITFWPRTGLGKSSLILTIICLALFLISTLTSIPLPMPAFLIIGLGLAGFITGLIAIIKKDRTIASIFPIAIGGVILFMIGSIFIGSLGIFKDFQIKETLSDSEIGEMSPGTSNFGWISENDNEIYYVNKNNLYKRNNDWGGRTKVADNPVDSVYISGDWIYYMENRNEGLLSKMKLDGSAAMKICDDPMGSFVVDGDWIFYNSMGTKEEKMAGGALYKIRNDGTGKTKLLDIRWDHGNPQGVIGDWVYFDDNNGIYRIKRDGSAKTLVAEGTRTIEYKSAGWLYYCISNDAGDGLVDISIYKVKPDGTETTLMAELSGIYSYEFDNDRFYYTTGEGLSRMRLDGSGKEKLNEISIWSLDGVSGDWFYISDYEGPAFRVKLDGSMGTRLN